MRNYGQRIQENRNEAAAGRGGDYRSHGATVLAQSADLDSFARTDTWANLPGTSFKVCNSQPLPFFRLARIEVECHLDRKRNYADAAIS